MYCAGTSLTCTANNCICATACCDVKVNTCQWASQSTSCGSDKHSPHSKRTVAVKADKSDFVTQCCVAKKTCDITCPTGMKDKTDKATSKCDGDTCDLAECCQYDDTKCFGKMNTGTTCGTLTKVYDPTKAGVTVTTYATDCCKTAVKCSTYTCPAGYKADQSKATKDCFGPACTQGECCTVDTTKCAGVTPDAGQTCDVTTELAGNPGAAAGPATYKAKCCVFKATCQAFKEGGSTSAGAVKQQVPALLALLAVGVFVALQN